MAKGIRAPKKPPEPKVERGRKFDRIKTFDERSREFPIRKVVPKKPRSYTWSVGPTYLDQGSEGACVGFGWAHELIARPKIISNVTNSFAREKLYWEMQKIDQWPGGAYPDASPFYEGTSVLAGAKIIVRLGGMLEYRWGFGLDDLRLGVGHEGPAVLGVNWHEGMFEPDANGFIHATGSVAGGHCIVCYAVNQKAKWFRLRNSWGESWGDKGDCLISFDDMAKLLDNDGEACFPVKRKKIQIEVNA